MIDRQLYLLSPYRLPTSYPLQTSEDEVSAWLSGYLMLWHPAALSGSSRPPEPANTYDHDSPRPNFIYSVPQGPHLYQPDDWALRVANVGAIAISATSDCEVTREKMLSALRQAGTSEALLNLPNELVRLFAGLGFGYIVVDSLFEAMSHDRLLDVPAFWSDVKLAVAACELEPDRDAVRQHLVNAAERLRTAREQLHAGSIYWLDWRFLEMEHFDSIWPQLLSHPLSIIATGENIERLARNLPERFAELKAAVATDQSKIDICSGSYRDREDALLPLESQWWNLRRARATVHDKLGIETTGYARQMSAFHPQLPSWLQHMGFRQALLVSFDGALIPSLRSTAVHWPGPDGKAVDAYAREPLPAHDPHTFFNLVYHLHQAISRDAIPTMSLIHKSRAAAKNFDDLLALSELAPVLGEWTTLSRYFTDGSAGEYVGAQHADEFFCDYLDQRVSTTHRPDPISGFARQLRLRRRLDSTFTLAALHLSLTPATAATDTTASLVEIEDAIELRGIDFPDSDEGGKALDPLEVQFAEIERAWGKRLAERVQVSSEGNRPGYMIFNPCGFTRRVALELPGFGGPTPIVDPIKAGEFEGDLARLVVEVPPLGFAWIPRSGQPGGAAPKPRLKTAEGSTIRNEFFEADIDPATGGLRAIRDLRTRTNRLGQQLVFNPGSKMRGTSTTITNAGICLGEITTEGEILDAHDEILATFRQRFRAWMGRPVLEIRTEFDIRHQPTGYPWHSYFGTRFGWRDERASLFRGVNGQNTSTTYTRPNSPDYLEMRLGHERTFLFTGGLPFMQRHGSRMIDVIMIPEGERERSFNLLLALDREQPMQTAIGWVSPCLLIETEKGPPRVGASSWLAHLDMPSLILTSLRPTQSSEGMNRAINAQVIECAGFAGSAELRFAREPAQAAVVDGVGNPQQPIVLAGGGVPIDYSASETLRMKSSGHEIDETAVIL